MCFSPTPSNHKHNFTCVSGNNYVKQKSHESRIHKCAPPLSSLGLLCYKVLLDSTPIQEGVIIFILIVSTSRIVLTLQG